MNTLNSDVSSLQNMNVNAEHHAFIEVTMPLLNFLPLLKKAQPIDNIQDIHALLMQGISLFEQNSIKIGMNTRIILAAKYCLCAALDEAIMCTSWGRESFWPEQTLLSVFFKETFGGERFFIILNTMLENPQANPAILKLLYILLSFGFKGNYYNKDPLLLKAIQQNLYGHIKPHMCTKQTYLNSDSNSIPKKPRFLQTSILYFIMLASLIGFYIFFNQSRHSQLNLFLELTASVRQTFTYPKGLLYGKNNHLT